MNRPDPRACAAAVAAVRRPRSEPRLQSEPRPSGSGFSIASNPTLRVLVFIAAAALVILHAQQGPDVTLHVTKPGELPVIAVPDLRAAGPAQSFMAAFNQTLWDDLLGSGVLKLAPKIGRASCRERVCELV